MFEIAKINKRLKEAEMAVDALMSLARYEGAGTSRAQAQSLVYQIKRNLEEATLIADNAGSSVKLAPYFVRGVKMSLPQAVMYLIDQTSDASQRLGLEM